MSQKGPSAQVQELLNVEISWRHQLAPARWRGLIEPIYWCTVGALFHVEQLKATRHLILDLFHVEHLAFSFQGQPPCAAQGPLSDARLALFHVEHSIRKELLTSDPDPEAVHETSREVAYSHQS